uniref:Uncharacterized protein n=1 Tax=Rhizophora mucronata TaxID=61149 RepID=A0A2P2QRP7_RHIMU
MEGENRQAILNQESYGN